MKTFYQQKQFANTWEYFCGKFEWENDPYAKDGLRYNIMLPKEKFYQRSKVIGTIELIPYRSTNPDSTVESRFSFSQIDDIASNQSKTWEIDKLCIHPDYQRQGYFEVFLYLLYEHAGEYQTKYYVALIEKKFYRMLRILFGSGIEQKGEELTGPTTSLIPVCANVEQLLNVYREKKLSFMRITY